VPEPQLKLTREFGGREWALTRDAVTKPRSSLPANAPFERVTLAEGTTVTCISVERSGKDRALHCELRVADVNVYVLGDPEKLFKQVPPVPPKETEDERGRREEAEERRAEAMVAANDAVDRYKTEYENRWFKLKVSLRLPRRGWARLVERESGTLVYVVRTALNWHLDSGLMINTERRWTELEVEENLVRVDDIHPSRFLAETTDEGVRQPIQDEIRYSVEMLKAALRIEHGRTQAT
jgi:hypothetical protein